MPNNFEELKRLFDEVCAESVDLIKNKPLQRISKHEAYVVVSLFQGLTYRDAQNILNEAIQLLITTRIDLPIDAGAVCNTVVSS